jgi:hypothetical protein
VLQAADARYQAAARLAAASAVYAGQLWDQVPLGSWQPRTLAVKVAGLQTIAVRGADPYLDAVLAEQGLDPSRTAELDAGTFAGVAGDGRPLTTLFDEPRIQALSLIGEGLGAQQAWDRARDSLRLMAVTAVQDAGRAADSVAMVTRPAAGGYVRMLNVPSCSRCTVLAGRFYRWNAGFSRHPRCDCRHVPSAENVADSLLTHPRKAIEAGQVTGLSRADLQAVLDGSDPGQVINAHRGMYTADVYGRRLEITTEGVTKRGFAGQRLAAQGGRYGKTPRLRPEAIYRLAGDDREEALRLLRRFGYLI